MVHAACSDTSTPFYTIAECTHVYLARKKEQLEGGGHASQVLHHNSEQIGATKLKVFQTKESQEMDSRHGYDGGNPVKVGHPPLRSGSPGILLVQARKVRP